MPVRINVICSKALVFPSPSFTRKASSLPGCTEHLWPNCIAFVLSEFSSRAQMRGIMAFLFFANDHTPRYYITNFAGSKAHTLSAKLF